MTPLMLGGNAISSQRQGKKTFRQQIKDYKEHSAAIEADAAQALVDERRARREASPDPAQLLMIAVGPRARLWERRRTDPDHLLVRVGTADLPSEVDDRRPGAARAPARRAADGPRRPGGRVAARVRRRRHRRPRRPAAPDRARGRSASSPCCRARATSSSTCSPTAGRGRLAVGRLAAAPARRPAGRTPLRPHRHRRRDARPPGRRARPDRRRPQSRPGPATGSGAGFERPGRRGRARRRAPAARAARRRHAAQGRAGASASTASASTPTTAAARGVRAPSSPRPTTGWTCGSSAPTTSSASAPTSSRRPGSSGSPARVAPIRDVSDTGEDGALPPSARLLDVLALEPPTPEAVVGPLVRRRLAPPRRSSASRSTGRSRSTCAATARTG